MRSSQLTRNLRRNVVRLVAISAIAYGTLFATVGGAWSTSATPAPVTATSVTDGCWQPSGICGNDTTLVPCDKAAAADTVTCNAPSPIVKWQPSGSNAEA